MTKRSSRECARDRKSSEDMKDDSSKPPPPKKKKDDDDTLWIKDDTLDSSSASVEEPSETQPIIQIIVQPPDQDDEEELIDLEDEDEEEFIDYLMTKYTNNKRPVTRSQNTRKKGEPKLPLQLSKAEMEYFKKQTTDRKDKLRMLMEKMTSLSISDRKSVV